MNAPKAAAGERGVLQLGCVIIGRNEGVRLERCLDLVRGEAVELVYVDSGSVDGSVQAARQRGIEVIELARDRPFTAARARNAGWKRLCERSPGIRWVQFIDGDCEICPGWLSSAAQALEIMPDVAAVCGRLREKHRDQTIYNRLCDLEWRYPVGDIEACGGIATMRVTALEQSGGFNPELIAGEEPDLCARLRLSGWRIVSLADDMAFHDAAMTRFSQWLKRTRRAGHAFAELAHSYGTELGYATKQSRSMVFWGGVLPLVSLGLAWPTNGTSLALCLGYGALYLRIASRARRRGFSGADARLYAAACVAGKFPQLIGWVEFHLWRLAGRKRSIIEHKAAA